MGRLSDEALSVCVDIAGAGVFFEKTLDRGLKMRILEANGLFFGKIRKNPENSGVLSRTAKVKAEGLRPSANGKRKDK